MTTIVCDSEIQQYVERLTPFIGHNFYAVVNYYGHYVVFAYARCCPLVVVAPQDDGRHIWFVDATAHDVLSASRLDQCFPDDADITWLSEIQLATLIEDGYDALVRKHLGIPL